jgi:hypothetical protein
MVVATETAHEVRSQICNKIHLHKGIGSGKVELCSGTSHSVTQRVCGRITA